MSAGFYDHQPLTLSATPLRVEHVPDVFPVDFVPALRNAVALVFQGVTI